MNVNTSTSSLLSTPALSALTALDGTSSDASTDAVAGAASSQALSKPGELLAALKKLKEQDPAQFKAVVTELAKEVRDQAQGATGKEAGFLNRFADRLDQVASSGDLSALQPRAHGGHHARGAQAYQAQPAADGDADDAGAASAAASTTPTDPRTQLDALLQGLLARVNQALQAGSSGTAATGEASPASSPAVIAL